MTIVDIRQYRPEVASFSMEVGLNKDIHIYSGGLGVLEGDILKSCADLSLPVVGVTNLYRDGYFQQIIDRNGWQHEHSDAWNPVSQGVKYLNEHVRLPVYNKDLGIQIAQIDIKGQTGYELPLLLMDTQAAGNEHWQKDLLGRLYDDHKKIPQRGILALGGMRALEHLGLDKHIQTYHLNEGHAALATIELLRKNGWHWDKARNQAVFTIHTPVPAGHDTFTYGALYDAFGSLLPQCDELKRLVGDNNEANFTKLCLNRSRYTFGVAEKHGEVTRNQFPGYKIGHVTNGVHLPTWTGDSFKGLLDQELPGWSNRPSMLEDALKIPDGAVWQAHMEQKLELLDYVKRVTGRTLDEDKLTIGFMRRCVPYKRADMFLWDIGRLVNICQGKVQFIFAGKAPPGFDGAKKILQDIYHHANDLAGKVDIVVLPNYNMEIGKIATSGVDVWLNNPKRPQEASGTSGMKVAPNGGLNLSILDGWWIEGYRLDKMAGWAIGPEANENSLCHYDEGKDSDSLYNMLEHEVIPMFYKNPSAWRQMMKHSITLGAYFNTHRVAKDYCKVWGLNRKLKI